MISATARESGAMNKRFDHVDWHLQVRAKSREEVDKVLEHFRQRAGVRLRVTSCEGSWRVKELFDVKLETPINCDQVQDAIFRVLLMMREVATGWQLKGPIDYEDNQWLFGGLASAPQARFHVPGIEWAHVETRNFPIVQRDKR